MNKQTLINIGATMMIGCGGATQPAIASTIDQLDLIVNPSEGRSDCVLLEEKIDSFPNDSTCDTIDPKGLDCLYIGELVDPSNDETCGSELIYTTTKNIAKNY